MLHGLAPGTDQTPENQSQHEAAVGQALPQAFQAFAESLRHRAAWQAEGPSRLLVRLTAEIAQDQRRAILLRQTVQFVAQRLAQLLHFQDSAALAGRFFRSAVSGL